VDYAGNLAGENAETAFWLELKRGDTIVLRIANNNPHGDGAASLVMKELTAVELLNSAESQQRPSP
jgi:hypothetical protein